ncbi:protein kinase domain protein [Stylonychia lemnae]|uniref:Protein kinase domain protein n=1 Tax=Stylonychia lemnae TaxID=5949 RepID=A0A078AMG0_STYLE|nr:protein kinase domain protein [Stylonychia lemnae]|eukprot:CDW83101.1 protein kinase domain protein [Stylonychia lemnae]
MLQLFKASPKNESGIRKVVQPSSPVASDKQNDQKLSPRFKDRKNHNQLLLKDQIVTVVERYLIQDENIDPENMTEVRIGQRGGFGRVYEFVNSENKQMYAAKIIDKQTLQKLRKKQKIQSEIQLHKRLEHPNIVKFEHFFEDEENVYMVLELCQNQTLADLLRRRQFLSEFETRYYIKQIISALKYLHNAPLRILHRDLKLGNIFLDSKMQVKLGDFGLATQLIQDNDLKQSICGTPNYMAPELIMAIGDSQTNDLKLCGYSFAADIWAVGVIMYSLVCGRPPFETPVVEETYKKIKKVNYIFPTEEQRKRMGLSPLSYEFMDLITLILQKDPRMRPSLDQIQSHSFFTSKYIIPAELPQYTLTQAPSKEFISHFKNDQLKKPDQIKKSPRNNLVILAQQSKTPELIFNLEFLEENLELKRLELELIDESLLVQRWADYTKKYGIGYKLTNNTYSVLFNDHTSISQSIEQQSNQMFSYCSVQTKDKKQEIQEYSIQSCPKILEKKMTLLRSFQKYLQQMELQTMLVPSYLDIRENVKNLKDIHVIQTFQGDKCMLFMMSNQQIQSHFNDNSMIIIDKKRKIGVFFSPKHPKVPYSFYINNPEEIKKIKPSAYKRYQIIQEYEKSSFQQYNEAKLQQLITAAIRQGEFYKRTQYTRVGWNQDNGYEYWIFNSKGNQQKRHYD